MNFIVEKIGFIIAIFAITMAIAAYSTYFERKFAAWFQDRIGPNRAGPWGIWQPLADGLKMFTKEEFIPQEANRWLFIAAPAIAMVGALMTSVVIPWAHPILVNGLEFKFQAADLNIGVLYVFGVVSLGVYGVMLGGWSSNNKYALMAAVRSSSQMISYEIAMGLAMLAILMSSGSLSLNDIVEQQSGMRWNVFYQPLAFLIFLVCSFAESNRMPFDLPESESELVGGYHTEYSSMKLGLFLFSEYVHMFISSAIISTLFFGGYSYPGMDWMANHFPIWATALSFVVFFTKILFFIFFYMWVRWTLPRFRYDQLMHLGWRILLPLAIFNILLTAVVIIGFDAL